VNDVKDEMGATGVTAAKIQIAMAAMAATGGSSG
jgi:hypothetical protein